MAQMIGEDFTQFDADSETAAIEVMDPAGEILARPDELAT